jgi:carbonic anhydrase/acetyltransferase-like protein (isoleucine patch superfamily)
MQSIAFAVRFFGSQVRRFLQFSSIMCAAIRFSSKPFFGSWCPVLVGQRQVVMAQVYFGGGRHCSSSALVGQVVAAALARGARVSVGCAVGADALVIGSALAQGAASSLAVHATFASSGAGAWSGSAVQVVQSAAAAGAPVAWLAGGALAVSLRARLMRRSLAGLSGSALAVFFSPGSGSLAVAGQAVRQGIPVYVFGASPALPRGCAGRWVSVRLSGFACLRFQPA